jgi:hypothetical protein
MPNGGGGIPPGNGGKGIPPAKEPAAAIGIFCGNIGFAPACPSAAYDDVIESMTDCAFS